MKRQYETVIFRLEQPTSKEGTDQFQSSSVQNNTKRNSHGRVKAERNVT